MITEGRFYVCFRKPEFHSESALSCSDLKTLVDAQQLQKKFNEGLSMAISNAGGTSIDAGSYTVLDMPLGALGGILNVQNSFPCHVPFGIGSTINGAYSACKLAHKLDKRVEMYIPNETEAKLAKNEDEFKEPEKDAVQMPVASPEEVEQHLLAEIQAKSTQVDPQQFYGLISEFQQVLTNFKANMPTIEMMQVTNPTAFSSILDVVNAASQFAQILMQSGILNTDLGMMMDQQAQQEQAAQREPEGQPEDGAADSSGDQEESKKKVTKPEDEAKAKPFNDFPVGSMKVSGTTYRIKTTDENGNIVWRYASKGLSQGPGGVAVPGSGSGSAEEGVSEPQAPKVTEDDVE